MAIEAPKIDKRTFTEIVRQILGDAETSGLRDYYTPEWTSRSSDDPGVVMVNLFARLMEIIIERLNSVPDKNFLTFLDLAGIDRLPGNPAQVPIQFTLAQGYTSGGEIPAGTQVATTQTETGDSYIFETEKKFFLSPVKLEKIFDLYPTEDKYDDLSTLVDTSSSIKFITFASKSKSSFEHMLYIGHDTMFGHKIPVDITLNIQTTEDVHIPNWKIKWRGFKDGDWKPLTIEDTTDDLRSAANAGKSVKIKNIANLEKTKIKDIKSYWIRAKLTTPIIPGIKLPTINTLTIEVVSSDEATPAPQRMLDQAFFNTISIDVQKDFYPFGETPKFNDTFYFANEEVFSQKGQKITIDVDLSPAESIPLPDTTKIKLRWEYYHHKLEKWQLLGESGKGYTGNLKKGDFNFTDETVAFTVNADKKITFTCPENIAKTKVNGVENYWIRARIVEGNYGEPAKYELAGSPPDGFIFQEATYKPPSIQSFLLSYKINDTTTTYSPQYCFTYNLLQYIDRIKNSQLDTPFSPFEATKDTDSALYLGFDDEFGDVPITIYFAIKEQVVPKQTQPGATGLIPSKTTNSDTPIIAWEYFNGAAWVRLNVLDGTANFTTQGTIAFVGPSDSATLVKFGLNKYWIRARLESGSFDQSPEIEGIFLNTVWAKNIVTQKEELIGSSSGQPDQNFFLSKKPVLEEEQIYISELEIPPIDEKQALEKIFDKSAVVPETNKITGKKEFWVRWIKVDNFYGSTAKSRHYTLDRVSGEIKFGDGKQGMIPPLGTNNIKAVIYQSGGGVAANQFATYGQVKELKSSIPYVDKATNVADAAGGSDPESMTNVRLRGPQAIKNRNRAITAQDFVWLTKQASTQVALVKCLPATNKNLQFQAGAVTMLIVPRSDAAKPLPSQQLINHIKTYLSARTEATVSKNISVIGPHYLRIDVTAKVQPQKPEEAKTVEQAISKNLTTFLHPLKGGPESEGWQFGRDVYVSEIYEVIEGTAGVDHVDSLRIQSSFWENVLVFANPAERFDVAIPSGAAISDIEGKIKLVLAEPIPARVNVSNIIIRGFQIGDRIKLRITIRFMVQNIRKRKNRKENANKIVQLIKKTYPTMFENERKQLELYLKQITNSEEYEVQLSNLQLMLESADEEALEIVIEKLEENIVPLIEKYPPIESSELEIIRISQDMLYFNTFKLSNSFDTGSQVIAIDKALQVLLAKDLQVNININSIRIKAFEGIGFSVKIQPAPTVVGESKLISRIETNLQRIPVNSYSLVYSGVHDIQMI